MNINELAAQVDVVDSIIITEENNTANVLAQWIAADPTITTYGNLTSAQAVRLFINWSDKGGTLDLQTGDFFTFIIPDIFDYSLINNITDAEIKNNGDVVATYSVYDNSSNMKEVKVIFTNYVETHTNISGDLWFLLFVGTVHTTEQKEIEFVINENLVAQGEVTINPGEGQVTPRNHKAGFSEPARIEKGFYIFEWLVYINMNENSKNGFNILENFSFEDVIPENSPHVFLTDQVRQQLEISPGDYMSEIGEYKGADSFMPADRYPLFFYHYNASEPDIWYNFIDWHPLANGLTTVGIDGGSGLDITALKTNDKVFSANLGRLTRPVAIRFFTAANIELTESALGDIEVTSLFKNIFKGSHGEALDSNLYVYYFGSGGSAQGIYGNYSFSFIKINEKDEPVSDAMFSLFTSDDFTVGADRIAFSDINGVVSFNNLPDGTFYVTETKARFGYARNNAIYKVVLNSEGFEIYYGPNFEYKLSDNGNQIVNRSIFDIKPVFVTFEGTKILSGKQLHAGQFHFIVKDAGGNKVAAGTNNSKGNIKFEEIMFSLPGTYIFTVQEVKENLSGIIYDSSQFVINVIVTDEGEGNLSAEVVYPFGEIVFNNKYTAPATKPKICCYKNTKCRTSVEGYKVWDDNDNAGGTRPDSVEILLLRDGEIYKRMFTNADNGWAFGFCCLPIWDNLGHKYSYQTDEVNVAGYTKTIQGFNIINRLIP